MCIRDRLSDSVYTGESFVRSGQDTVSFEKLSLVQEGKTLFYIPIVSNQNGGQPVRFHLSEAGDGVLVFENPAHDFPQKITYTRIKTDSIVAEISGKTGKEEKREQFPMIRVK